MNKSVIFRAKPYKSQIYHPSDKRYSAVTERLNLTTKATFLSKFKIELDQRRLPLNQIFLRRLFVKNHTLKFHSPEKVSIHSKNMWKLWDKRFPSNILNSNYCEKYTLYRFI